MKIGFICLDDAGLVSLTEKEASVERDLSREARKALSKDNS
jgi:hypothetical protein